MIDRNDPYPWMNQARDGWATSDDALADNAEAQYAASLKQYQDDLIISDALGSGNGAVLLEFIRSKTIEQPSFIPGSLGIETGIAGLSAAEQGFIREGQNSMYRWFIDAIARAAAGAPQPPAQSQAQE